MIPGLLRRAAPALACSRAFALSLFGLAAAPAADITWNALQTGTQAWNLGGNWLGGVAPGATSGSTNADTAILGTGTAATLLTIDAGRNVRSLLFNGTNTAGLYTIGSAGANAGEALRLSSGGSLTVAAGTLTATAVHAPLILEPASGSAAGSYTFANNATSADADPNAYKLLIHGDIQGGATSGTITLNLAGTAGNRSDNNSVNRISGRISDGGAQGGLIMAVTGASGGQRGAWELTNNANSFTGPVTVTNATLQVTSIADAGVASALGAGNALTVGGGSHLKYFGGTASSNRTVTGGGSFYNLGTGALTLTGSVLLPGSLTFRGGQNFIVEGLVSGTGGLSRTDAGTVILTRTNTFSGSISISDGAFRVPEIADSGVDSPLGRGSVISLGQNSVTVGRLEFTGAAGGSTNREIRLSNGNGASSGNGRIDNTVAGQTLVLNGTVRSTSPTATHVSSLNLTGLGNGVLNGIVGGTTAAPGAAIALQLSKTGTGTWVLTAANNYTRGTLVSTGTLLVNNSSGSGTGSGSVTTSGSATLGGTGTIAGGAGAALTVAAGTRLMVGNTHGLGLGAAGAAGTASAPAALTLGSASDVALTLAGTLQFDLYRQAGDLAAADADRLRLQTAAASLTLGGTVAVANATGTPTLWKAGAWQLIDWSGIGAATRSGTLGFDFSQTALASGFSWDSSSFQADGILRLVRASNHTWLGTSGSSWAAGANWEIGSVPGSGNDVFFDAAAGGNLVSAIDGDRNARDFYFTADGSFTINTGTGGVLYSHGSLMLVEGGAQRFGAQLRLASGSLGSYRFINNGTLTFDQAVMFHRTSGSAALKTLHFSGTGATTVNHFLRRTSGYDVDLVLDGPGSLTVTSYTDFVAGGSAGAITGTTTLNGGILILGDERSLGGDPAAFNAAHLRFNGGTLRPSASFTLDDANRGVTFDTGGGTLDVTDAAHTLSFAVPLSGAGGLTLTGAGRVVLESEASTFSGTTQVEGGTLQVGRNGQGVSGRGTLTVAESARLAGTGRIAASSLTLQSGASLLPGDLLAGGASGHGTLTFGAANTASYLFDTGSTIALGLGGPTNAGALEPLFGGHAPGSPEYDALVLSLAALNGGAGDHDRLVFDGPGTAAFNGRMSLALGGGFVPASGMVFNLLDWTALTDVDFSQFDSGPNLRDGASDQAGDFDLPDLSAYGLLWDVHLFTSHGVIAVVPEPTRALLLLLGLSALLGRRRRPAVQG